MASGALEEEREGRRDRTAHPTSDGDCHSRPKHQERSAMITFLGTVIFAVVIGIGSLDSRSGLAVFGKYTAAGVIRRRSRPAGRRGEDPAPR
jgi:hypothetical protein